MPNPKRTLQALSAGPERVGSVTLQPLTIGHSIVLEQCGSPLMGIDTQEAKAALARLKALDLVSTAYVLAVPVEESLAAINAGKAEFAAAVARWAASIPAGDCMLLAGAVLRIFARVSDVAPQGATDANGGDPQGNGRAATAGSRR